MNKPYSGGIHTTPIVLILFLILALTGNIHASAYSIKQQRQVSGVVTDASGEPIPGVNVVLKGTTTGVISDIEGRYSINVPGRNAILVFSFVGYVSHEFPVGDQTAIDIVLDEETKELEEIIVVGYGTMKKSDLTGSVTRVTMEEKTALPNVSIAQALSGASAGVNFQASGLAGSEPSLSIRGQNSLSASSSPLLVLDGIIFNGSISDININDVEYIDILKDASAAAVYGSKSANGVIIITTKKGKTDKPKISFNMYYGLQGMTNNPMKVMDAEQYAIRMVDYYYQQDLYKWYATNPTSDAGKPVRLDITDRSSVASQLRTQEERDNYMAGNEVDWVDAVQRNKSTIQNYNLSFSGRSERSNYFVSGSYTKEEGVLKNDQFERYTLHSNVESKLTQWFTLGVNVSYSYRDYSGINADLDQARKASPLANDDVGNPKFATYLTGESYMPNPLGKTTASNEDIRNSLFFVANAKIEIPFVKGLTYDFNYSNTYYSRKNNTFYPVSISDGIELNGKALREPEEDRSWLINNIVTYLRSFGNHQVNATLLFSRENRHGGSYTFQAEGFDNPVLGYHNMMMGTKLSTSKPKAWEENSLSYMARLNYQYKHRYMITGTVRSDGYSGFGPNSKWVTLPSVSLGWVATEEDFMRDLRWLYLKLRFSYGQNGNQGSGRYSSFFKMDNNAYVYGSNTAIAVYPNTMMGNPDLAWEKTASFNLGLDYAFLNRRIYGNIDVYSAKTTDVLVKREVPQSNGYDNVWSNIGGIKNKGIDFELTTVNFQQKDFQWRTSFVFSLNRDKITKLYGGDNDKDIGNSWFVGEPITAIYDYRFAGGVWTEQELYEGKTVKGWYPGQYRYADLNRDGTIEPEKDREVIGYKTPNYRFSISSTLSYKGFSLFFLINSIQGGNGYYMMDNYNVVNVASRSDDVYRMNQSAVRQYWTPENGVDNATGIYNSPARTSGIYESRSFVRLQDVSLSYSFSKNLLDKIGVDDLQVFISGKNLYTWTKWSGWDPEVIYWDYEAKENKNVNDPMMRNVIVGFKLSF